MNSAVAPREALDCRVWFDVVNLLEQQFKLDPFAPALLECSTVLRPGLLSSREFFIGREVVIGLHEFLSPLRCLRDTLPVGLENGFRKIQPTGSDFVVELLAVLRKSIQIGLKKIHPLRINAENESIEPPARKGVVELDLRKMMLLG